MSDDPTLLVLTFAFGAGLGVFLLAAGWKWLAAFRAGALRETPADTSAPPPLPPAGRVAVWIYRPLDLLGALVVFGVFASLVLLAASVAGDKEPVLDAGTLAANIGFQFTMAGLVGLTVISRCGPLEWLGLRWPSWPWVFLLAPGAVLFMWLVAGGLHYAGYVEWMESLGVDTTQDTVKLLRETDDPLTLGLMAFAAVIAAPVCEEIVFRGYLYPLLKKFGGITAAAIGTSLVFAAAHGHLTAIVPLFVFGVVLVLLYEKTGSLWAPIAAHFCFNGATVGVTFAARYYDIPIGLIP
ncbi:MAG: CPBP family intramembrane glutamic endopeptidase [Luteolibacter sp.]